MDGGGSGVAEHNSVRSTTWDQPFTISLSAAHIHKSFLFKSELYRGVLKGCKWAWLRVVLCLLPVFIHRKIKNYCHEDHWTDTSLETSIWGSRSPQRLRAQWQLGIQNKTTNWISHHYQPTHYAHTVRTASWSMKTIAFYAWRRMKGSTTWAYSGHGDFNNCCGMLCRKSVCSWRTVSHVQIACFGQLSCLVIVAATTCLHSYNIECLTVMQ